MFTVRRIFNYEGHYTETQVDVKSPLLKDALIDVIGDIRGVSLVEDVPEVDPNMLFNYYSELQAWIDKASGKVMVPIPDDKQKTRKRKKKIDPLTGAPVDRKSVV